MPVVWGVWFGGAVLAGFVILETIALITGRQTLSRTVWRAEARFPIISFVTGAAIGGLAIHFFGWIPACQP